MNTITRVSLVTGLLVATLHGAGCYSVPSPYDRVLKSNDDGIRNADATHNRWVTSGYGPYRSASGPAATETAGTSDAPVREVLASSAASSKSPSQPEVEFTEPTTERPAASPRTIGIYGELIGLDQGLSDERDTPMAGTENLAQVTFALEGACRSPHIDATGRWMTFSGTMHRPTSDIYIKTVNGTSLTQLTTDPAEDLTPQFSPNKEMIAFASNRSGNWDIWMMPADGGVPIRVTDSDEHELHPTFSADGRQVAYCRYGFRSGQWEIWVSELGRPGVQRFLTYGLFPQWSPDPMRPRIAFQRPRERGSRHHSVWMLDYREGEATNISEIVSARNAAAMHPSWSPDGESLVFVTVIAPDPEPGAPPQVAEVWAIDADGRNRRNLMRGDFSNLQPSWAADGRVYFVSDRSGVENIWSVRAGDEHHLRTWERDFAGTRGEH